MIKLMFQQPVVLKAGEGVTFTFRKEGDHITEIAVTKDDVVIPDHTITIELVDAVDPLEETRSRIHFNTVAKQRQ